MTRYPMCLRTLLTLSIVLTGVSASRPACSGGGVPVTTISRVLRLRFLRRRWRAFRPRAGRWLPRLPQLPTRRRSR